MTDDPQKAQAECLTYLKHLKEMIRKLPLSGEREQALGKIMEAEFWTALSPTSFNVKTCEVPL